MARATRIACDLALVSIQKVCPLVSKLWGVTRNTIENTKAAPIVNNIVIRKVETGLNSLTDFAVSKITDLRNKQYETEKKYLEKELMRIDEELKKIGKKDSAAKAAKPVISTAWRYAKVEVVPPMTQKAFSGPLGASIEGFADKMGSSIIATLEETIKQMDLAAAEQLKKKELALKAAELEAKKKAEEEKKQKAVEDNKKKAEEAKKAATEVKKAPVEKKAADPKENKAKEEKSKSATAPAKKKEKSKGSKSAKSKAKKAKKDPKK